MSIPTLEQIAVMRESPSLDFDTTPKAEVIDNEQSAETSDEVKESLKPENSALRISYTNYAYVSFLVLFDTDK